MLARLLIAPLLAIFAEALRRGWEVYFTAGPVARLLLRLPDGRQLDAEIARAQLETMALRPGDEVGLRFRTTRRFQISGE